MTMWELLTHVSAVVGGGGLTRLVTKVAEVRKEQARVAREKVRADADVAKRALDLVAEEREDTQEHARGWRDCEKRCQRLERLCEKLTARVDTLERLSEAERAAREAIQGDLNNANQKVELLEGQNAALDAELKRFKADLAMMRPSSRPAPPPPPSPRLRVIEEDATKRQGGKRHGDS